MKDFKNLNKTYKQLQQEIESYKRDTIKLVAEYNSITDKVKLEEAKLDKIKKEWTEFIHTSKSEIRRYNKEYKAEIDSKAKELALLSTQQAEKQAEIDHRESELIKYELQLQKKETEQIRREKTIEIQENDINKKIYENKVESNSLDKKKKKFKKDMSGLQDWFDILSKEYKWLKDTIEKTKEDRDRQEARLKWKEISLKAWEKELSTREQKYESDIRTLLSAKNTNVKSTTKHK